MAERRSHVVVVGAGVIGLTTAVCLAEQGLQVQVKTRCAPTATTSAVASAMIGPSFAPADDVHGVWERAGITEFTALADVAGSGVTARRGRLLSRQAGPSLPGLRPCSDSELPIGFDAGFWATLPLVDMPIYLDYLMRRLTAAGGRIERTEVQNLDEVAADAPLIANCAGLGARELVRDRAMRPVRGQQVIVDNPGIEEFLIEAPIGPHWTAFWPYPNHVVLGGTQTEDDENLEPDPAVAREILRRCSEVEPLLQGAAVRSHQVGLRPGRPTVRLELERIRDSRCVHNYGHGGSGVTTSWGTARDAAALLTG
jgi:D-amino-acid oxidase